MSSIFNPATILMDRVRYPVKFAIIFLIVLIPLVILSLNMITTINDDISFLQNERSGLTYIKSVRQPMEYIQQHRGMTAAYLNGSTEFRERIMQKRMIVDQKLAELKEVDVKLSERLGITGIVTGLLQQWSQIKSNSMNMNTADAIKVHSALISGMLDLMSKAADSSEITLDPKLDSYYMGDAIVSGLPNLLENMGQARAVGSGVAAQNGFSDSKQRVKLAVLSNNIKLYADGLNSGLQAAYVENREVGDKLLAATESNSDSVRDMQRLLNDKLLNSAEINISSEAIFDAASEAISGSYKLYDALVPELDALFFERIEFGRSYMLMAISVVSIVLLLVAYLFVGFYYSVRNSIDLISNATQKLADGDLTVQVELTAQDEMSQIASSFNVMAQSFNQMVRQILSSTEQLGSSSEELSAISVQTNQSIGAQQVQTEEVATAMNQMSTTVLEVSKNITNTAASAEEASKNTTEGRDKVDLAVEAIQVLAGKIQSGATVIKQLEQDSKAISSVLEVIEGVAEQTNLLALNAAIEAARAGEHGRGFAVVADEVRTLAGRTQESTAEISQVIEKLQTGSNKAVGVMRQSQADAESVVSQAIEAGTSLSGISSAVERINEMSTDIAGAAEEQSVTAEQINRSIVNIDEMTKETASAAQQTALASEGLTRMASELKVVVARFAV